VAEPAARRCRTEATDLRVDSAFFLAVIAAASFSALWTSLARGLDFFRYTHIREQTNNQTPNPNVFRFFSFQMKKALRGNANTARWL